MTQKTIAIIQARMGSSRLPGKVMKMLCGRPVLAHVIDRVRQMVEIDDLVVATTDRDQDDPITRLCNGNNVKYFRGSEEDVLSRYFHAARENQAATIVRITSDCPLFDAPIGDSVLRFYKQNNFDIVTNAGALDTKRTFPPGMDTEVFSFDCLEKAFYQAQKKYHREHVTPYIYETQKTYNLQHHRDFSGYRLTLDTPEDYDVIQAIYHALYRGSHDFYLTDIIALLDSSPGLQEINGMVRQKQYTE